jgi:hypothetical protein
MFGLDAKGFHDMEAIRGTIHGHTIAWKSGRSWQGNNKAQQCQTSFQGTLNGDSISGHFEQTWYHDGKKADTYNGIVELRAAYRLDGRFVVNGYDGNPWTNQ